jgi:hypothetical protein
MEPKLCCTMLLCLASSIGWDLCCATKGPAVSRLALDRPRYPMDIPAKVVVSVVGDAGTKIGAMGASSTLPPPPLYLTLRRGHGGCFAGRSTNPGGAGFNCYADWAMKLPPIGDNFKKNQTYDFEVVELTPQGVGMLPRVATPGNTSACLSGADGRCLSGFEPTFFEHFVGAAVEFSYRPFIEETSGAIVVTLDSSLSTGSVKANIAGAVQVSGTAVPGVGSLIPFDLGKLPTVVDDMVTIAISTTLHAQKLEFVHERLFLRTAPPRNGTHCGSPCTQQVRRSPVTNRSL